MASNENGKAPHIAKWFENRTAAISLRFDDACYTHVNIAIPILNKHEIKGTFMVNPGRRSYKRHKAFWEREVPQMGHSLGNHTWNHKGATTPEMAEFEIGAVSRLIWDLCPGKSKLNVFASGGGGKKWGGKYWRDADPVYKRLINEYFLIDLYDGSHPYLSADTKATIEGMCDAVDKAIADKRHQAYVFHRIGQAARNIKGIARYLLRGYDIALGESDFTAFIGYLSKLQQQVWTAPLIDILKYETEYINTNMKVFEKQENDFTIELRVRTDAELYDHPLTMVVPGLEAERVEQITGTDRTKVAGYCQNGNLLFNLNPVDSMVEITSR